MVTAASDPTRMEAESCPPGGLCDQAPYPDYQPSPGMIAAPEQRKKAGTIVIHPLCLQEDLLGRKPGNE